MLHAELRTHLEVLVGISTVRRNIQIHNLITSNRQLVSQRSEGQMFRGRA